MVNTVMAIYVFSLQIMVVVVKDRHPARLHSTACQTMQQNGKSAILVKAVLTAAVGLPLTWSRLPSLRPNLHYPIRPPIMMAAPTPLAPAAEAVVQSIMQPATIILHGTIGQRMYQAVQNQEPRMSKQRLLAIIFTLTVKKLLSIQL